MNREIDKNIFIEIDLSVKKDNIFGNKICFYPPSLKWVGGNNYCHLHNNDIL